MRLLYNMSEDYPDDCIYIGRGSEWGNPYSHILGKGELPAANREDAVRLFGVKVENDPEFQQRIRDELKGKRLVCYCTPRRCHGEVLIQVANYES